MKEFMPGPSSFEYDADGREIEKPLPPTNFVKTYEEGPAANPLEAGNPTKPLEEMSLSEIQEHIAELEKRRRELLSNPERHPDDAEIERSLDRNLRQAREALQRGNN